MKMPLIYFASISPQLADEWDRQTGQECFRGDILNVQADAIVSPANSFGFMDGGVDLCYLHRFGAVVQHELQARIKERFGGELLVGQATAIPLAKNEMFPRDKFRWLISAPTMRVPMTIPPWFVFLAARAAMRLAIEIGVDSIVFPGMGTGTGRVAPFNAVKAMVAGFEAAAGIGPEFPTTLLDAMIQHEKQSVGAIEPSNGRSFFSRRTNAHT